MPYDPQPFDYEPVTRRSASLAERLEDEERFSVLRRPLPSTDADDWVIPDDNLPPPTVAASAPLAATAQHTEDSHRRVAKGLSHVLRRGHTLSFAGLFLFTVVLYFRPHEVFQAFSSLTTLAYWIAVSTLGIFVPTQLGLEGNLTVRPREVNLILLLSLCAMLSVPFALDPSEARATCIELLKVFAMFIVMVNVMRTERRLKILIFLSLAVGCIVSAGAIGDYRLGHFADRGQRIAGVIGGMFGNSNDMALHLVVMTPIAVALFFSTRNIFKKTFFGACAGLMMIGNIVTFSRGGLLGLLGALTVLLWKLGRRHRLLVFVLAISLALALIVFMPGAMVERLASIFNPATDEHAGGSVISRRALLVRSLQMMLHHPLLGLGLGNFHTVSIREQVTHNAYTQVGAEMGVPAMLLYIMFILAAFKRVSGIEKETLWEQHHSRFYYLSVGLQASIVGYMISSFFLSVAYQHYLYYLIGYAICLHRIYVTSGRAVTAGAENQTEQKETTERWPQAVLPKPEALST